MFPTSRKMVAFLFMLDRGAARGIENGKDRNTEGVGRTEGRKDMVLPFLRSFEDAMPTYLTGE